jgi:hypothetical protein
MISFPYLKILIITAALVENHSSNKATCFKDNEFPTQEPHAMAAKKTFGYSIIMT